MLLSHMSHCGLVDTPLVELVRLVLQQRQPYPELLQLQQAVLEVLPAVWQSLLTAIPLLSVLLILLARRLLGQLME